MLHTQWHLEYKGSVKKERFILYEVVLASLTAGINNILKDFIIGRLVQVNYIV